MSKLIKVLDTNLKSYTDVLKLCIDLCIENEKGKKYLNMERFTVYDEKNKIGLRTNSGAFTFEGMGKEMKICAASEVFPHTLFPGDKLIVGNKKAVLEYFLNHIEPRLRDDYKGIIEEYQKEIKSGSDNYSARYAPQEKASMSVD